MSGPSQLTLWFSNSEIIAWIHWNTAERTQPHPLGLCTSHSTEINVSQNMKESKLLINPWIRELKLSKILLGDKWRVKLGSSRIHMTAEPIMSCESISAVSLYNADNYSISLKWFLWRLARLEHRKILEPLQEDCSIKVGFCFFVNGSKKKNHKTKQQTKQNPHEVEKKRKKRKRERRKSASKKG